MSGQKNLTRPRILETLKIVQGGPDSEEAHDPAVSGLRNVRNGPQKNMTRPRILETLKIAKARLPLIRLDSLLVARAGRKAFSTWVRIGNCDPFVNSRFKGVSTDLLKTCWWEFIQAKHGGPKAVSI